MASRVRPRGRQINAYQLVALFLAFVLVSGVGGVLAAGLLVPLAAGANTATDTAVEVFDELPADLEPGPLSEQSRIYAKDGTTRLATFYTENRIVVPLDQVSDAMKNAVIAIEDKRFWDHGGVDVEGLPRAVVNNITGGDTQGASTLTQQYVKNVLIEQAVRDDDTMALYEANEKSLGRKAREAKLAIALEKKMTKEEILQGYLNIAQFGRSVYGVETAARHYFNKSAIDLDYVEAATIAGITKAPSTYDPTTEPENAQKRRDIVLNQMYQQGFITREEYDTGRTRPIAETLSVQPLEAGCQASGGSAFFCDYVTKIIMSDPVFGETKEERQTLLYRGGLDIYTTLDPAMQAAAEQHAAAAVPADDPSQIEDAIVTVEPGTGNILAMAQNRAFDNTQEPAPNTTAVNYSVDQAHGSSNGFSPGSTWKPFVLAEWLNEGHSLYENVSATKRTWTLSRDFHASCVRFGNEQWTPANSDGDGQGSMSVLKATYNSVNTAYTTMASKLDLCGVASTATAAGFQPSMLEDGGEVKVRPSMILGTQNSSPLQMAAAYATFASGGTYCSPVAITKVLDSNGQELPRALRGLPGERDRPGRREHRHVRAPAGADAGFRARQRAGRRSSRGRQDRHGEQQHAHVVHRVHAAGRDRRLDRQRGGRRPDEPEHLRESIHDQREVAPVLVRLEPGRTDLARLHEPDPRRPARPGLRRPGLEAGQRPRPAAHGADDARGRRRRPGWW